MSVLNLDPKFKPSPWKNSQEIPVNLFNFPGGECHVKISRTPVNQESQITITTRLRNGNDLMNLLLATDAVKRQYKDVPVSAFIPYIPYSRQDRPMVPGEPFSLKVFANLINSQNYNKVYCFDPHSDVTPALIENLQVLDSTYLIEAKNDIVEKFGEFVMIAPDGGALKKIYKQAEFIGYKGEIFCATKVRDVTTGKIVRTKVEAAKEDIAGKVVVITDDIISYGNTFMSLATALKEMGADKVILCVTHYEGVTDLQKAQAAGIDHIYTTNSICDIESAGITQFKL